MSVAKSQTRSSVSGQTTTIQVAAAEKLGPNYLQILESNGESKHNFRDNISRILVVSKIPQDIDSRDIVKLHEKIFESVLSEEHAAPITGVMITQKDTILHLIETSMDTSTSFLRHLQRSHNEISQSRILASCEDCSSLYYSKWFHYHIQLQPEEGIDFDCEDPVDAASSILEKLSQLHDDILSLGSPSSSELRRKSSQLIPSNERCRALACNNSFINIGTFLDIYDTPIDMLLQSEKLWPFQPYL